MCNPSDLLDLINSLNPLDLIRALRVIAFLARLRKKSKASRPVDPKAAAPDSPARNQDTPPTTLSGRSLPKTRW